MSHKHILFESIMALQKNKFKFKTTLEIFLNTYSLIYEQQSAQVPNMIKDEVSEEKDDESIHDNTTVEENEEVLEQSNDILNKLMNNIEMRELITEISKVPKPILEEIINKYKDKWTIEMSELITEISKVPKRILEELINKYKDENSTDKVYEEKEDESIESTVEEDFLKLKQELMDSPSHKRKRTESVKVVPVHQELIKSPSPKRRKKDSVKVVPEQLMKIDHFVHKDPNMTPLIFQGVYLEQKCSNLYNHLSIIFGFPERYSASSFKKYIQDHFLAKLKKYPHKKSQPTRKWNFLQCMLFDILLAKTCIYNQEGDKYNESMDLLKSIEHISDLFMFGNHENFDILKEYHPEISATNQEFYRNPILSNYAKFKTEFKRRIKNL